MDQIPVRIQGEPEVIDAMAELLEASDAAQVIRIEQDDTGGIGADFDLATISTIVGLVSSLFFSGPIVPELFGIFKRHQGTRITVETPTRTVSIQATADLSVDALQRMLTAALES